MKTEKCSNRESLPEHKTVEQLCKVSTPCLEDQEIKKEDSETVGELSNVCSQVVLKCLYLARIGRPETVWSVNKLARAYTTWTRSHKLDV